MFAVMTQRGGVTETDWTWAEWEAGYGEDGTVENPIVHRTRDGAERALSAIEQSSELAVTVCRVKNWSGAIVVD